MYILGLVLSVLAGGLAGYFYGFDAIAPIIIGQVGIALMLSTI
jgi:hypothetical protein